MNTGYTIKHDSAGYLVEFFRMNSQTLEVNLIETRGPFATKQEAKNAETEWAWERD
jgi:hypothetical protein